MTRATALRSTLHYDVTIETVPKLRLATLPHRGDYQKIGASFERLFAWAGGLGLLRPGVRMIGIYYDDPDSKPLADELGGRDFNTVIGTVRFDQKGDLSQNPYRLFRYDGTRFVPDEAK